MTKRTLTLVLALALIGALTFGTTIVRADGSDDDHSQATCTSSTSGGQDGRGDARLVRSDREDGTESGDEIEGQAGDDEIDGEAGDDELCGRSGDDDINGGAGDDDISGGRGHDRISGGRGNDHIFVRDGERDRVTCGPGRDTVRADKRDAVAKDCEKVAR